MKAAKPGT